MQISERGHVFRPCVIEIMLIDQMDAAVDDRSFSGLQAVSASGDQLKEGQHELTLHRQRIAVVIAHVQIQRIDIAGLPVVADAGRRDLHDLAVQMRDEGRVFALRVADQNVIVRAGKKHVCDLPLGREGFAAAGNAEDQTVGVFELLAIHHDHVVRQGVDPVVQRPWPRLKKLLGRERDEDRRAAGGKAALDLNEVVSQRQRTHQAFFLLKIQMYQRTVMPLSNVTELH